MDRNAGCSPLQVGFTNTSSGVSSIASYLWEFGNGNSSVLKDPGAVFTQPGTYLVKLTLTQGNQTSVVTKTVTVYRDPEIDFTVSGTKGCAPYAVTFTANAKAGDGSLQAYIWDFGDGNIQTTSSPVYQHTYQTSQRSTVSLTVANSLGCHVTTEKKELVEVLSKMTSDFKPETNYLCRVGDDVKLLNLSIGPGALSYEWDFGDGQKVTDKDPQHRFNRSGAYTVSLTVNSSEGCSVTETKTNVINVANIKSDFSLSGNICPGSPFTIRNTSFPRPDSYTWQVNAVDYVQPFPGDILVSLNSRQNRIRLFNRFGNCSDTIERIITINTPVALSGFEVELVDRCAYPNEYIFRDTSAGAVSWLWTGSGIYKDGKSIRSQFSQNGENSITLTVRDTAGCEFRVSKTIQVRMPHARLQVSAPSNQSPMGICGSGERVFSVVTQDSIEKYAWKSGSGLTSTEASPTFKYDKSGNYRPEVELTTDDGCIFRVISPLDIQVRDSVRADFEMSQLVCGNSEVVVTNTSTFSGVSLFNDYSYSVSFGDGYGGSINNPYQVKHRYLDTGTFTITMEVTDRICRSEIKKVSHVRVLPALAVLSKIPEYSCEGSHGKIRQYYNAKYATSASIDFGDGTIIPLAAGEGFIEHEYKRTGIYKVVLTTSNGSCIGVDSTQFGVYLSQQPVLSAERVDLCSNNEYVRFKISNMERSTGGSSPTGNFIARLQDESGRILASSATFNNWDTANVYVAIGNYMANLESGKVRLIIQHFPFGCSDTTGWINLTVGPPIAMIISVPRSCSNGDTMYFKDINRVPEGRKIVKWEWFFGQEQFRITHTESKEVGYRFRQEGVQYVRLDVTDDKGCRFSMSRGFEVSNTSLHASFTVPKTTISQGATLTFTNTSSSTDPSNTSYLWVFGDGSSSTEQNPQKFFGQPGTYTVYLIARNTILGCVDTSATTTITVKYVNSAFSMNSGYILASGCLPYRVQFTNTSSNVTAIFWDFGDGATSALSNPVHLYTRPGTYVVTQKTFSDNGSMYTATDTLRIFAPAVSLNADSLTGCANQSKSLRAASTAGQRFIWDAGDGSVVSGTDSTLSHRYLSAGVFSPRIIVSDLNGCKVSATLKDSIRIDSLGLQILDLPAQVCAPKTLELRAAVVTAIQGQALTYTWTSGSQTSSMPLATFNFSTTGIHTVQLTARSQFGCVRTVTQQVEALQGLGAVINGPADICQGNMANFTASAQAGGTSTWQWTFPDGSTYSLREPPSYTFTQAGSFPVKLVVLNNGCNDTIIRIISVKPNPTGIIAQRSESICNGSAVALRASGGFSYRWTPSISLLSDTGAIVMAAPSSSTTYVVTATSQYGCSGKDSVVVRVVRKQQVKLPAEKSFCEGIAVQLSATGTDTYQWIGNTAGLSSTTVADPMARPSSTRVYTVVGSDFSNCFTDTATVKMIRLPTPTVDAGPDGEVPAGGTYPLSTQTSTDVNQFRWKPETYLSCSTCPAPVSSPMENMVYTVTVTNDKGCTASDTVSVNVLCQESRIFIPNIFTPNGDGKNDLFMISGQGITLVKSLKIYDRFGSVIFERSNFQINDPGSAWNGKIKGMLVPVGSYVYVTELSCDNRIIIKRGTVTLVY